MNKNFPAGSGMRRLKWMCACLMILACASLGLAQAPVDAPVLISEDTSTRALAVEPATLRTNRVPLTGEPLWHAAEGVRVTLFVTNLDLMPGEGANAFRADAETASGRRYNLPVESIRQMRSMDWIHAVTLTLNPELGDAGDVLVRLNWRGMASNRVRLSVGHIGGVISDDLGAVPTPAPRSRPKPREETTELRIGRPMSPDNIRFLEQATFGPTFESELRLRRVGIRRWLDEQFARRVDANGNDRYSSIPYPALPLRPLVPEPPPAPPCDIGTTCYRDRYTMYPLQNWMFQEAIYGEDQQLRRRVSWALHQIMVVSGRDTQQPAHMLPYVQLLDKHAFGNFGDLLYEMTLNPAMGNYLDMVRSTATNPNENYAREILQLFSLGVDMLNPDGTPMLDQQGNRIPSYNQDTINNFTRVFTGWKLCGSACAPITQPGIPNYISDMRVTLSDHDAGQKTLLPLNGAPVVISAGMNPDLELLRAIDNIFNHPNVGPFISKLLIQHLVTSNPTPAYVGRVASAFNNNGTGLRGDMKAVITAILLDPEARGDLKTDPDYGKLRDPFLFTINLLRPFDPRSSARTANSDGVINSMTITLGQDIFNPETVFSYYSPEYIVPNTSVVGPEYSLLTTGTALKRPNFVNQMVFTTAGIPANVANNIPVGTSISMDRMLGLATADPSGAQLVDTLDKLLLHSSMSQAMRSSILQAVQAVPGTNPLKRARTAVYLVTTSSQYQVQR